MSWHVLPWMLALDVLCHVQAVHCGSSCNVPAAATATAAAAFHKRRVRRVRSRPHRPTCTGHRKGTCCKELHRAVIYDDRVIDCHVLSRVVKCLSYLGYLDHYIEAMNLPFFLSGRDDSKAGAREGLSAAIAGAVAICGDLEMRPKHLIDC